MVYIKTSRNNQAPLYPPTCTDYNENQLSAANGLYMSIVLAEPRIYVNGLEEHERAEQTPAMLRGSLIVRATKPTKVKSISLSFKGTAKTEWPEGIPPAKVDISETETIYSHAWPFFDATSKMAEYSSGAHMIRLMKDAPSESGGGGSVSPTRSRASRELSTDHRKSLFKMRAASPAPASKSDSSSVDLVSLAPHRSWSKQEVYDNEVHTKGYRTLQPGEYIYNFELPIHHSLPETINTNYGSVYYQLEGVIQRAGAFKSNLVGQKEVELIRATSFNNLETSEPINIDKKWEGQMDYEILISGKMFAIGTNIPMTFKLTPINADMKCHRIRVYLSESVEYYCRRKRVHRNEPTKRYMLKEHVAKNGLSGSLVDTHVRTTSLDYQVAIPRTFGTSSNSKEMLHPNTTSDVIKVHHWIKIVMRLSKIEDGKRKYFEISIDSPIALLHPTCLPAQLELPQYTRPNLTRNPSSIGMSLMPPATTPKNPPPYMQPPPSYEAVNEADESDETGSSEEDYFGTNHSKQEPQPTNRSSPPSLSESMPSSAAQSPAETVPDMPPHLAVAKHSVNQDADRPVMI